MTNRGACEYFRKEVTRMGCWVKDLRGDDMVEFVREALFYLRYAGRYLDAIDKLEQAGLDNEYAMDSTEKTLGHPIP